MYLKYLKYSPAGFSGFPEEYFLVSPYPHSSTGRIVNLATKTTALLAIIIFTVLVITSLFFLHWQGASLRQAIFNGLDGQAKTAAHGIESFLTESQTETQAVALTLPVKALFTENQGEVESHLKLMFETFTKFENGIFVLDREGRFLTDYPAHPELRGQSFAYREYFQRTIQENRGIISNPYRSIRTGQPVLTFTAPVRDATGRTIAVLACSVNLVSPQALGGYRTEKFGKTGYLYIFDGSRLLVLHPDDKRMLTAVEEGKNKILEAALQGFEGAGETVNSQGVPMLLAVRQVKNSEWIVAVQVPREEAYTPLVEARGRIITIAALAILIGTLIGTMAVRRVSRPLQELERVACRISAELEDAKLKKDRHVDDYSLESLRKIDSNDEIGRLSFSFLGLVTKLDQSFGSLQRATADWELTFNSVNEAIVTLDTASRIVRMNSTAEAWFRTSTQTAQGQYAYGVIFGTQAPPEDWPDIALLMEEQKVKWSQNLERPSAIFEFTLTPITSSHATVGAVLIVTDVTERVESEGRIREIAFFDTLTGLPNRLLLQDRIQQAIASASRNGNKAAIMFLDLDRFKEINDLHGHDAGDVVLRQVAQRISRCLRKNDTLARLGGDEFVVVLQDIDKPSLATMVAEKIIELQTHSLTVGDHALRIGTTIGIALFPDDGMDSETLLKHADIAMYRAKGRGRNTYQYYTGC
jgi:diguanylate cyclase (GGDEF)-like protein